MVRKVVDQEKKYGNNSRYRTLHIWIETRLGNPRKCSNCRTTKAKKFEWANISGKYKKNIKDFKRLCTKCHRKFDDTSPKGEKHHWSKLTKKDILKIRKYYIPYIFGFKKLAKKFGVSPTCIVAILKRKNWKHIK